MTIGELTELYYNLEELKNKTIDEFNSSIKFAKFKGFIPLFHNGVFKLYNNNCTIFFKVIEVPHGAKIVGYEVKI